MVAGDAIGDIVEGTLGNAFAARVEQDTV